MATADVAVVGGGPAGLMAAEAALRGGVQVDLYDAMPSVGRKLLLAGKGGLNLTHSEPQAAFVGRYGARRAALQPLLDRFGADALRAWAAELGVETFVGSSGRVFPRDLKAAPLLRAWLQRLRTQGLRLHMRHRCIGLDADGTLRFETPAGAATVQARAIVLALGGASWPRLGSDGAWTAWSGLPVVPLRPSNCGFDRPEPGWSAFFRDRFAGHPLKNVALAIDGFAQPGEFVVTATGVEGSLVYAASSAIRDAIDRHGHATVHVDLLPQRDAAFVAAEVARPRGSRSLSTHLKSRLGLDGVKAALLHELLPREAFADTKALAAAIQSLPLALARARPIAEAISTAGGVPFEALDAGLAWRGRPSVHVAGEMLDWEAPTGGYLLTACFASGLVAGESAAAAVAHSAPSSQ